jgi:serine/threonine-protein kinase RsbW
VDTAFPRKIASLDSIFEQISDFAEANAIDQESAFAVRLAVEELFVNMVKYNPGKSADIRIKIARVGDQLIASITDPGGQMFDVTKAPAYDGSLPLEARRPGGLGIHLARSMMNEIRYAYENGSGTITLTRNLARRR